MAMFNQIKIALCKDKKYTRCHPVLPRRVHVEKPFYELLAEEVKQLGQVFREHVSEKQVDRVLGDGCVAATGSGDSFAAALVLASLAGENGEAVDPLEAIAAARHRSLARRGCTLAAISIGGRTKSVLELAELYASRRGRVVCYTAKDTPLAKRACSEVVEVTYPGTVMGVGAARQLVLLGLIAKSLGYEPRLGSLNTPCAWLRADMFTGLAESLGTAIYAVNKLYEIYAKPVRWEYLEQLVHAPIYSARSVAVFYTATAPRKRLDEITKTLREAGIKVYKIPATGTPWDNAVTQTAYVLSCIARQAAKDKVAEPAYRKHPGLEPLTRLIYG